MNRIFKMALVFGLICLINFNTHAEKEPGEDILIVVPAQSIVNFSAKLFPYQINMGDLFKGSLWIKSIDHFKIEANKISFSANIYGKDIVYTPRIGNQSAMIALGDIDLTNDWESTFRFDHDKKILHIKPHLKQKNPDRKANQKEAIINTLLKVFSDIEYPIDLRETNPITAEFLGNVIHINLGISNIYAAKNKLMILLRPTPRVLEEKKTPARRG